MIKIGKYRIFFGDFHGQWNASEEEMALLVAGLWYYGYDFTAFQSPDRYRFLKRILYFNQIPISAFPGKEYVYEWGHLTTVKVKGRAPDADNIDYKKVLKWFKEHSNWVVMAHPYEFMIDHLEELIDLNLLDAIELVNGPLSSNRNNILLRWYSSLLRKGKSVPIVSGLDIHIPKGASRPEIMYTEDYPPSADIELFGTNRTGVITDECSIEGIKEAIKKRQTFIELPGYHLIGPPEIVEYLEKNNYMKKAEEDIKRRHLLIPSIENRIIGNANVELHYQYPVKNIIVDGKEYSPSSQYKGLIEVPVSSHRNTYYINVVSKRDNVLSVNALKVYHPVHTEVFPEVYLNRYSTLIKISNYSSEILRNLNINISCENKKYSKLLPDIPPYRMEKLIYKWDIKTPLRPSRFDISIRNKKINKSFSKYLVFIDCPYIKEPEKEEGWRRIVSVKMSGDLPEQVDNNYTVYWNGNNDLSAEIKMGWNEDALYFKLKIMDDILCPSKVPNLLMFGDCFQIGINPVDTEAVGNQSFYDIMMTRGTENGKEKAYMERQINMALEYTQKQRISLDGLYKGSVKNNVFNGLLKLPFSLLPPMQPVKGYRFGLYYVIFDNDGKGLKTSFQWPLSSERYIGQAWYIPYYGGWANVLLK